MVEQWTKALRRRSAARRRAHDTLSTPEGQAIPIWEPDASDPVAHMAQVFDQLPGRRRSVAGGRHRNS